MAFCSSMTLDLKGKQVVVTGGGGALGSAVVEVLKAAGAECLVPLRSAGVDLTDEASVAKFYAGVPRLWASVHCAGGFAMAPFAETPLSLLKSQLDVNLTTAFLCCREAVKRIRAASGEGRIVNVTSKAADVASGGAVAYAASKAAVSQLTRSLAEEL